MGGPVDFYGPYLKTERAEHHIAKLEEIFGRYVRTNQKALLAQGDRNSGKGLAGIGGGFPRHTPTVLGDALHNLRAALDHAYCILVEANGHTISRDTKFPIHKKGTRQDFAGSIKGHEVAGHGPGAKIIDLIVNHIQPFPGGNGLDLIKLDVLDITDKHHVLLPAVQMTRIEMIQLKGGGRIQGLSIAAPSHAAGAIGPGAIKQDGNNKASFDICFAEGQPYEGQPILDILKGLLVRIRQTLAALEEAANTS